MILTIFADYQLPLFCAVLYLYHDKG